MKKFKYLIFVLIFILGISLPVNAETYEKGTLIPLDTNATVYTDLFQYDFVAGSSLNDKGNSVITFSSIKNLSDEKLPVSINILLFDAESKNIGYLTYCSEKDVSTEFAGFKLDGGASTPYYINVVSRYFANKKGPSDVKYIAVYDENKYCHIGGYDKFEGLTIEQINFKESEQYGKAISFLKNGAITFIIILLFIGIGLLFIEGLIINTLHRKMFNEGNVFSFLPITNNYVAVKCAFGPMAAKIYVIGLIISVIIAKFIPVFSSLIGLFTLVALIVVIIKLVTKNYTLFTGADTDVPTNKKISKKQKEEPVEQKIENVAPAVPTVEEVIAANKEEALDISYNSNGVSVSSQKSNDTSSPSNEPVSELSGMFNGTTSNFESTNISDSNQFMDVNPPESTDSSSTDNNFINFNTGNSNSSQENTNNNKDGESELSKFFQ